MRTDGRLDCRCACKPLSTLPWSVRAKGRMQENAGGSGFNSLLSYVPNHTHTHTHTVPLNCSTGAQLLCIGPPLQLNIPKPPATTAYATTVSVPPPNPLPRTSANIAIACRPSPYACEAIPADSLASPSAFLLSSHQHDSHQ